MMKISTMKLLANLKKKNLLMDGCTTSNPFWGRHARNPLRSPYPWAGVWCYGVVFARSVQYKLPRSAIFCSVEPVSRYKSHLRLQSRRSVRNSLRPIRRRFVIFANVGFSRICPIWISTDSSLPSLLRCELRYELFSSLCFRDVHREMVLSLSRSSESINIKIIFV